MKKERKFLLTKSKATVKLFIWTKCVSKDIFTVLCKIFRKIFKKFDKFNKKSVKLQLKDMASAKKKCSRRKLTSSCHISHARLFTKTFQLRSRVLPCTLKRTPVLASAVSLAGHPDTAGKETLFSTN